MELNDKEKSLIEHYDNNLEYLSHLDNNDESIEENVGFYNQIKSKKIKYILDLGCGTGKIIDIHGRNWNPEYTYNGVDYSRNRINEAKKIYRDKRKKHNINFYWQSVYEFLEAEMSKIRREEERYDCICIFDTLEHLGEPLYVINASRSILKENGIIIGTVPINSYYRAHLQVYKNRNDFLYQMNPSAAKEYKGKIFFIYNGI